MRVTASNPAHSTRPEDDDNGQAAAVRHLQEGFQAEDDLGASEDYVRENNDEEAFRKARVRILA